MKESLFRGVKWADPLVIIGPGTAHKPWQDQAGPGRAD